LEKEKRRNYGRPLLVQPVIIPSQAGSENRRRRRGRGKQKRRGRSRVETDGLQTLGCQKQPLPRNSRERRAQEYGRVKKAYSERQKKRGKRRGKKKRNKKLREKVAKEQARE